MVEHIASRLLFIEPYRCLDCGRRFFGVRHTPRDVSRQRPDCKRYEELFLGPTRGSRRSNFQVATEILTETIDAKGAFNILSDWYMNQAGRDDPKAMDKLEQGEKVIEALKRIDVPRGKFFITASRRQVVR